MKSAEWKARIDTLPTGLTYKQAADALGADYRLAYTHLKRHYTPGSDGRRQLKTPGSRSERDWSGVDWSKRTSDIARELGVSRQAVHDMRRRVESRQPAPQPQPEPVNDDATGPAGATLP